MKKRVEEWKFSGGALVMCLVAYSDGHNVKTFQYVIAIYMSFRDMPHYIPSVKTSPMVSNPFTHACNDWRDGTYKNFKEWAVKQFGHKDMDTDDEAEVPVDMQKAKDISFQRNKKGQYIVPEMANFNTIRQKQRVVRGYIGAVYRMSFFIS